MIVLSHAEFVAFCVFAIGAFLVTGAVFWAEILHWQRLHAQSSSRAKLAEDQLEEWLSAQEREAQRQLNGYRIRRS